MVTKKTFLKRILKSALSLTSIQSCTEYRVPSLPACLSLYYFIPETIRNCSAGVLQKSLVTLHNCQHTSESEKKEESTKNSFSTH